MKQLVIGGGKYKNKKIICPSQDIRPVMSKVREAIFNILEHKLHYSFQFDSDIPNINYSFLDLFSGSGLMAIEAVSRGVSKAVSVEKDKSKWRIIMQNFSLDSQSLILIRNSAELFLLKNTQPFNIIYVDPPFNYAYKNDLMTKIINSKASNTNTTIILHAPSKEPIHKNVNDFACIDLRKFGGSTVYFYQSNTIS